MAITQKLVGHTARRTTDVRISMRFAFGMHGTPHPVPRPVPVLRAAGLVIVALAVIGAGLTAKSLTADRGPDPNRPAFEVGIADPAPTSFGTIAVEFAEFLGGPTANALTGATHNVGALVAPNRMQVEATVTISNFSKQVVRYAPDQFTLKVGKGDPLLAKRSSVTAGELQPDASIDVRLIFETGLSKAPATLSYTEATTGPPVLMRLGRHTGQPQRAHGEKPGEILGVGQQHHTATPAGNAGKAAAAGPAGATSGRSP